MPLLTRSNSQAAGITWFDITLVITLMMLWFFITQIWVNQLANTMFSVSILILAVYLIARFTGFLQFIKLTVPTWTISAVISIPFWLVYIAFVPGVSTSSVGSTQESQFVINDLISEQTAERFLNIFMFPMTESLLVIFIFAFFLGVATRNSGKTKSISKADGLAPFLLVSAFGALIHSAIAKKIQEVISFSVSLGQQFVSFAWMTFLAFFLFAPAVVSSHMIKNAMLIGSTGWVISVILFCVVMDIASLLVGGMKLSTSAKVPTKFT